MATRKSGPATENKEEQAEQAAEVEATQAEELEKAKEEEAKAPKKRKHALPEGYITPVAFRHALVEKGHAGDNLSSAQIYILSRKASTNGMPVKHFDADGNAYDELQTNEAGETTTRPGLKLDEGLKWWVERPKRQPGAKKKVVEGDENPDVEGSVVGAEAGLKEDEERVGDTGEEFDEAEEFVEAE
jgi:hypothetical protein